MSKFITLSIAGVLLATAQISQSAFVLTNYLKYNPWQSPVSYQLHSALSAKAKYIIPQLMEEISQEIPSLTFSKLSDAGNPDSSISPLLFFRRENTANVFFCEDENVSIGNSQSATYTTINVIQNSNIDCATRGWILHLMLHAFGFVHEHQRYDRAYFVYVNPFNMDRRLFSQSIRSNLMIETRFDASFAPTWNPAYDFASVMHYHFSALASNGQATLLPLPPYSVSWLSYGHATNMELNYTATSFLSYTDIDALHQLFPAPERKPISLSAFCLNGGTYFNWCICPPGFGGRYCEEIHCFRKCKNGGYCTVHGHNQPACMCPSRYTGNFCEVDTLISSQTCSSSTGGCPYWSECKVMGTTAQCDCNPFPYQGKNCSSPYVYVETTPSPTTHTQWPGPTTTTSTTEPATGTSTLPTTFSQVFAETTPVACTFGQMIPTAKPKPFSKTDIYLRIALTDIYYRPEFVNLNSSHSRWLRTFLWQVMKTDYLTHSNGKFDDIELVRVQPPFWGESTWFWNPSRIIAAFGCVIVDYVATFTQPITPLERQMILAATARYADGDLPILIGRYGDDPMKSTRVSKVGYITAHNLILTKVVPCTVYVAESYCLNGGQCTTFDSSTPSCICLPGFKGEYCEYAVTQRIEIEWPSWLIVFTTLGSLIAVLLFVLLILYCRGRCKLGSNKMWFPPSNYPLYDHPEIWPPTHAYRPSRSVATSDRQFTSPPIMKVNGTVARNQPTNISPTFSNNRREWKTDKF